MTSAEIYQWMVNPSLLTKASLFDLKQMIEAFPYFHAARMLYLKNLALLNDVRFEKELQKMSAHIPDRRALFLLIEESQRILKQQQKISKPSVAPFSEREKKKPSQSVTKEPGTGTAVVSETKTTTSKTSVRGVPSVDLSATSDYISWLETNVKDIDSESESKTRLKHQELIDSFIENENKQPGKRLAPILNKSVESDEVQEESLQEDEIFEKTQLDDSYFTETLARVYVKQKRYDKALEIIRVLSLKYPEKNIYFADQIRYLEKIINIKK